MTGASAPVAMLNWWETVTYRTMKVFWDAGGAQNNH